jgi:hypothetical protein
MPDAQNAHDLGSCIDFVKQDIGEDDNLFSGAVLSFSTDVWKHGEVCGGVDQPEQNPLGRVWVAGQQAVNQW